jgi:hypothetical protein
MNNGNWASMVPTLARTHRVTGAGLIGVRGS